MAAVTRGALGFERLGVLLGRLVQSDRFALVVADAAKVRRVGPDSYSVLAHRVRRVAR